MRLPTDEEVAGKAHRVRLPRQPCVRIEIDLRQHIVRVRPLPQAPNRPAGKTHAFADGVPQRRHRHHFHLSRSRHIDKLHEEKFNALLREAFFNRVAIRHNRLLVQGFPGIQSVPAKGILAMAAASMVSAAKSSGSKL